MSWTSAYAAVEVGGATLHGMIAETAMRLGNRPALVDGRSGSAVTYATLASRMEGVAAGLAARGFAPGHVLALWAPNLPQWAGVALGAMAAGGTVTGANPACTERELALQLSDSGASMLVTIPSLAPTALAAATFAGVREVIVLGEADSATPISAVLPADASTLHVALDPDTAVALMPYSSGTTGLPKGVMLTHTNLVTTVRQLQRVLRVSQGDTLMAVAPFFHVMGFVVHVATALASGATVVTMPRFDLEEFLGLIQQHRATFLVAPPPLMAALAHHPLVDAYELSSVEFIICGGAPLSADVQRAVAARIPTAIIGQGWGMTETTIGATAADRALGSVPGSVGRVMPNTQLRVVDPQTGQDLGVHERGELWIKGPQLMAGYRNNPAATAETIDAHGWLHTGDLGYIDQDGNVFIVDRLKELIKVNAYQVAPAELEALLATHPAVADVAVIPRPDQAQGEIPVVVARGEVDGNELKAWLAERVAPHKRIRAVRFVDAIPRTPSGKILRRLLVPHSNQTVQPWAMNR